MEQESEEEVKFKFDEVCGELNLDQEAKESAWHSYRTIYNDYVLEGSQIEWLACALYVACRSTSTQTVDGNNYSGNSISLTQILRVTKLRLIEFFRKVKKWLEMAKLPQVYLEKVETLERKFEVISVIFKKYKAEFSIIFQLPDSEAHTPTSGGSSRPRSRKPNKSRPCSSGQLFQFGWVLYIYIKNQFPLISDDLVNSHYLLLCCLDMLYAAAICCDRRELVNGDFSGTPTDSASLDDCPNILPELCRQFAAIERECQVVRDYYWWPSVRRLFESETLVGVASESPELIEVLSCLVQPGSFQTNYRSLKTAYELVMLQEGDFDERVFLNGPSEFENCSQQDGQHEKERLQPGVVYQSPQHLQYGTPFSGREYLTTRESKLTPVSDANQSVIHLHLLLEDCHPTPTDSIITTCSSCPSDPLKSIKLRMEEMSKAFLSAFKADSFVSPDNFVLLRLKLSQTLYFKLLAAIISDEENKQKHSQTKYASIQLMLEHDYFHKSLFALSVEMVLFSYSSHTRIFPWILSVIDIPCYHFYKVIEVIIKVESGFPRAVVKHLSKIEELVLTSLAWKSSSPLFDSIASAGSVPRYEDVALPNNPIVMTTPTLLSPRNSRPRSSRDLVASPLSARDRYSSPNPASSRRQLFTARKTAGGSPVKSPLAVPLKQPPPLAPKPPQGVVQVQQLKPLQDAAVAVLSTLLQQKTASPQKPTPILPAGGLPSSSSSQDLANVTIQALVSMANMKSPLLSSPDNRGSTVPTITLTVSPTQAKTTPTSKVATPTGTMLSSSSYSTPQRNSSSVAAATAAPKRTGSLALFFRKVYQMSFLRIKDLCERLQLNVDIIQKVWTCFEHCLVTSPDTMRDRNIDQIIMCSIYIVAKVLRKDVTFQEIMRQYRHQPQAKSHVYRSVLLNNGTPSYRTTPLAPPSPQKTQTLSQQQTGDEIETQAGNESTVNELCSRNHHHDPERAKENVCDNISPVDSRGDIIQFYNRVFIDQVKDFVLKFSPSDEGNDLLLSPLPVIKRTAMSPRKLSKGHQIFISPLKGVQSSLSPLAKTYVVSKSPASEFQELNHVIGAANRSTTTSCKRKLDVLLCNSPGLSSPAKRSHLERRLGANNTQNLLTTQGVSTVPQLAVAPSLRAAASNGQSS